MSATPKAATRPADHLEAATYQAMAGCGGDARAAVKSLIVANGFLEAELDRLRSEVSAGYARGRLRFRRDRKE